MWFTFTLSTGEVAEVLAEEEESVALAAAPEVDADVARDIISIIVASATLLRLYSSKFRDLFSHRVAMCLNHVSGQVDVCVVY